MDKIDGQMDVG